MIKILSFPVLILLLTGSGGCHKSTGNSYVEPDSLFTTSDYAISYQQWKLAKPRHQNSYRYTVRESSWNGSAHTTTITVENGNVVSRSFVADTMNHQTGERVIVKNWEETSASLNSHNEGVEANTLDVIYQNCAANWLRVDKKANNVYFEGVHRGILSLCGFSPKNCADDCFTGIAITEFEWLQ